MRRLKVVPAASSILVTCLLLCSVLTHAAQLEMHPPGRFSDVIPTMHPGDTLVVGDGIYRDTLQARCGENAPNGTPGAPITIRAEHERQAWLKGNGQDAAILMRGCTYWTFHGLQVSSMDAASSDDSISAVIDIHDSSHLTLRRMLVHHNNRYFNNSLLLMVQTSESLVEESEFYAFHRYAVITKSGTHNTFRRNYINSRGHGDLPDGYASGMPDRGDASICIYPGSYHVLENNISEHNGAAVFMEAIHTTVQNRILGQISLNDLYGVLPRARGASADMMPHETRIENLVAIHPTFVGVYARSNKETTCTNCSIVGGQQGLVAELYETYPGDRVLSFGADNVLIMGTTQLGVNMSSQSSWHIDNPNMYGNSQNFSPAGVPQLTNVRTMDPALGNCRVWIPDESPLKHAGSHGRDIGANVVYRYENGTLTGVPLWSPSFPCGAIVPGVNDVAGASCFDVHQRLGVGADGCTPPLGDGGPPPPPPGPLPRPTNFRLVRQP